MLFIYVAGAACACVTVSGAAIYFAARKQYAVAALMVVPVVVSVLLCTGVLLRARLVERKSKK
jgi:ABC-type transport system involved in cytochrome c biogenesis permease component